MSTVGYVDADELLLTSTAVGLEVGPKDCTFVGTTVGVAENAGKGTVLGRILIAGAKSCLGG